MMSAEPGAAAATRSRAARTISGLALALLSAVAAAPLASPLAAQMGPAAADALGPVLVAEQRPIRLGGSAEGTITAEDPRFDDGSYFHAWRFSGEREQEIVVEMRSADFDAFLMLAFISDGSVDLIDLDDDGAGGTDARINTVLPRNGEYLIVANTLFPDAHGRYTISALPLADACERGGPCDAAVAVTGARAQNPVASGTPRAIGLGDIFVDTIRASDPTLPDESHYHLWLYEGTAGERIVVDHESGDFDAYLMIMRQADDGPAPLRSDDDGGEGTNAQLAIELPVTGTYLLVANTLGQGETGAYRITLRSLEVACATGGPCQLTPDLAEFRTNPLAGVAEVPATPIALGDAVEGRLERNGPRMGDGTAFRSYGFRADAGEEVVITLDSEDFDAYLYLVSRAGDELDIVEANDDGGLGLNSLISARLERGGEYLILANGLGGDDLGAYRLTLQRLEDACAAGGVCRVGDDATVAGIEQAVRAAPSAAVTRGQELRQRLTDASPTLPAGNAFHAWLYFGRAGEELVITQRSEDFDSYLRLYRISDEDFEEIATDDDGAGNLDARIAVELPADGEYMILASSYGASARGSYELSVLTIADSCAAGGPCSLEESAASAEWILPALEADHRAIRLGEQAGGELVQGGPTLPDGSHFHAYRFHSAAGERVVIAMESDDFDTFLHLVRLTPDGGAVVVGTDDDGGVGLNSRLVATLPVEADYIVIANGLSEDDVGGYTLSVERCDEECAAAAGSDDGGMDRLVQTVLAAPRHRAPLGSPVMDELTAQDPTLDDGSHFHAYWLEAEAGQRLVVTLRSSDFDAFLGLLRADADTLEGIASDDDGAGGTDARIELTLDEGGTYVVLVNTFADGATGRYTLEVELR